MSAFDVGVPCGRRGGRSCTERIDQRLVGCRDVTAVQHVISVVAAAGSEVPFQDTGARTADKDIVAGAGHEDIVPRPAVEQHAELDRRIDLDQVVADAAQKRDAVDADGYGELYLADEGTESRLLSAAVNVFGVLGTLLK